MKPNALVCLLLLLSAAPAWGQYDQQPLFMQYVDQYGKPAAEVLADRRRLVFPLWNERFPFVDLMLASDTVLARGYLLDTLTFVPDGPVREFYSNGKLREIRRYAQGRKSGRWVDFYPSGDTSRIYAFRSDTAVSSVCLAPDYSVIHTGFDCGEKEAQPLNLTEVKTMIGYPPAAREAGIQGKVIFLFWVNTEGLAEKHKVVWQAHPMLTAAVKRHVNKLRFEPGQLHGKPLATWVTVPFDFKILGGR